MWRFKELFWLRLRKNGPRNIGLISGMKFHVPGCNKNKQHASYISTVLWKAVDNKLIYIHDKRLWTILKYSTQEADIAWLPILHFFWYVSLAFPVRKSPLSAQLRRENGREGVWAIDAELPSISALPAPHH